MKKMRRVVAGLLALGMVFALTACGGKEQTVTYRLETEQNGLKMEDTMTLTAKGDTVQKMSEVVKVDTSTLEDEQKEVINTLYDQMVEKYKAVDGVECTGEKTDTSYTITIDIDATGNAVKELSEQGLLQVDGNANRISLKVTGSSLESAGYKKAE